MSEAVNTCMVCHPPRLMYNSKILNNKKLVPPSSDFSLMIDYFLILQLRKLCLGDVKGLTQGHRAHKPWPGVSASSMAPEHWNPLTSRTSWLGEQIPVGWPWGRLPRDGDSGKQAGGAGSKCEGIWIGSWSWASKEAHCSSLIPILVTKRDKSP